MKRRTYCCMLAATAALIVASDTANAFTLFQPSPILCIAERSTKTRNKSTTYLKAEFGLDLTPLFFPEQAIADFGKNAGGQQLAFQASLGGFLNKLTALAASGVAWFLKLPRRRNVTIVAACLLLLLLLWKRIRGRDHTTHRHDNQRHIRAAAVAAPILPGIPYLKKRGGDVPQLFADGEHKTTEQYQVAKKLHSLILVNNNAHTTEVPEQQQQQRSPREREFAVQAMCQIVKSNQKSTAYLWNDLYQRSGIPLFPEVGGMEKAVIQTLLEQLQLAEWANVDDTERLRMQLSDKSTPRMFHWKLIRHVKKNTATGGHYVAIDPAHGIATISFQGSLTHIHKDDEDFVSDAFGKPVTYTIDTQNGDDVDGGGEEDEEETSYAGGVNGQSLQVTCHEGILKAGLAIQDDIEQLIKHLFIPAGYKIILVGHSLGAGVATMVGTLIKARFPDAPIEIVAFAPPPMLDLEASRMIAPYTTSIINNDDLIPRASQANLKALSNFEGKVHERLSERGVLVAKPRSAAARLLKKTVLHDTQQQPNQFQRIMTPQEIFNGLRGSSSDKLDLQQLDTDDNHLVVPGRSVILHDKYVGDRNEYSSLPTRELVVLKKGFDEVNKLLSESEDLLQKMRSIMGTEAEKERGLKNYKKRLLNKYTDAFNILSGDKSTDKEAIDTKGSRVRDDELDGEVEVSNVESDVLVMELDDIEARLNRHMSAVADFNGDHSSVESQPEETEIENEEDTGERPTTGTTTEIAVDRNGAVRPDVIDIGAIVTDGGAPVLRQINLNDRMLADHMPEAYEQALRALLYRAKD